MVHVAMDRLDSPVVLADYAALAPTRPASTIEPQKVKRILLEVIQ